MTTTPARSRAQSVLARTLFAVAMAETVTTVVAAAASQVPFATAVGSYTVTNGAMGLAFPVCGILLAWHRPRNPIGWLFLAAGLGMATSAATAALALLGSVSGWNIGVLRALGTAFTYAWPWTIALFLPVALLLFPDGRPVAPRWRWVIMAAVVNSVVFVASLGNPAQETVGSYRLTIYLAVPDYRQLGALWAATNLAWAVILAAAITSLAIRYRRGDDTLRRQLLWLLLALLVIFPYVGVSWGVFNSGPILGLLVLPSIPIAVTVAILRYQLLDIRVVISRALVYVLLTAGVIAIYAGLVGLLDLVVRRRFSLAAAVVASIIIAFSFNPVRVQLQRLIDQALYGDRRDPVRAVSLVGERLAGIGSQATDLSGVLEALCGSLRLPYAALRSGSVVVAVHGTPPERRHAIGLAFDGAAIGELVVGLRSGQNRATPQDAAVLQLLAGPLAVALHATELSAQLQESRLDIVAAREEERRRLRRDLHDGLGPVLTGIAFKADAARNALAGLGGGQNGSGAPGQAGQARELLTTLRADTTAAIDDIRRLVYGLRPPALDDLGLIGSLREQSARLAQRPDGRRMSVRLRAPDRMPPLAAAVEVAAYRIVTEAMMNAARHSDATSIDVRIHLTEHDLRIEVTDDGHSPAGGWAPGVGLTSMHERAAELGGSCQAGPDPDGGRVTAVLPLSRPPGTSSPPATVLASGPDDRPGIDRPGIDRAEATMTEASTP